MPVTANEQVEAPDSGGAPHVGIRYFLVDLDYNAGEEFCSRLLDTGDFSVGLLNRFAEQGAKGLKKSELASHVASRVHRREIDPDELMRAYCEQPRQWLCVRFGQRPRIWPRMRTALEFLTKRESGLEWYGPFGTGDERYYVATKSISHLVKITEKEWIPFMVRWQVVAQVTDSFVALHWYNASTREQENVNNPSQFPYWDHLDDIFASLGEYLHGRWDRAKPNLAELILHSAFDRYADAPGHKWIHRAVRAAYQSVALNASGGGKGSAEERAASGLQILTQNLASTAAKAIGLQNDASAVARIEHALLRKILRDWGTKSYEFQLDSNPVTRLARMRIYFGSDSLIGDRKSADTIQHVHCYAKYCYRAA